MKIFEYDVNEISTPTGTIYIRFRERMGDVPISAKGAEKEPYIYLTAYAGFANSPMELKQADALRNFNNLKSGEDIVNMIKSIFNDKLFLSAKTVTVYDELTDAQANRHPFLNQFFNWVSRNGGERINIVYKEPGEGGPNLKRPRKKNPNKGRKIRDIPQGETKKTVTFTVGSRFYREIQNNLPNIMKYRGPNGTFVMPSEIFNAFRQQAEAKFPFADIKVQNRVATGEGLNEGSDKSAHDCGIVDGYYGRPPNPYKIEMGQRIKLTDPAEIKDYMAGYNDDSVGSKVYESDDPIDKDARDSYGSRAPGVKKLKDGKYHAVNADGEHKIFASKEQAERHAKKRKTNEDNMDITSSSQPDHEASMAKGELYNTVKNAKELFHMIQDGENLEGWVASKITRAADYINTVHDYMMYEKQYSESINEVGDTRRGQKLLNKVHKRASDRLGKAVANGDAKNAKKYQDVGHQAWDRMPADKWDESLRESLNERSTSEKQARTMAAAAHDPKFAKKVGIKTSVAKEFNKADKGTKRLSNAMKKKTSESLGEAGFMDKVKGALGMGKKDAPSAPAAKIDTKPIDTKVDSAPAPKGAIVTYKGEKFEKAHDGSWESQTFVASPKSFPREWKAIEAEYAKSGQAPAAAKDPFISGYASGNSVLNRVFGGGVPMHNVGKLLGHGSGNYAVVLRFPNQKFYEIKYSQGEHSISSSKETREGYYRLQKTRDGRNWERGEFKPYNVSQSQIGFESVEEDVTDEGGPASRSLCRSKKPDSALGASNLASCVSQGLRAHKSGRADYVNGKQLRVGGKKVKGKAHGGPLPDYS